MKAITRIIALAFATALTITAVAFHSPSASAAQSQGHLVIVYADGLKPAADAWTEYRGGQGGWNVTTHAVASTDKPDNQLKDIQQFIRQARESSHPAPFAVLLLGDANPDNAADKDSEEAGKNLCIPTWHFPQTDPSLGSKYDPEFISDQPYQTLHDADDAPAFPLG